MDQRSAYGRVAGGEAAHNAFGHGPEVWGWAGHKTLKSSWGRALHNRHKTTPESSRNIPEYGGTLFYLTWTMGEVLIVPFSLSGDHICST